MFDPLTFFFGEVSDNSLSDGVGYFGKGEDLF